MGRQPAASAAFASRRSRGASSEADLLLIEELSNGKMLSMREIADHLNRIRPYQLSHQMVFKDYQENTRRCRELLGLKLIDMKLQQWRRLETLEREAMVRRGHLQT